MNKARLISALPQRPRVGAPGPVSLRGEARVCLSAARGLNPRVCTSLPGRREWDRHRPHGAAGRARSAVMVGVAGPPLSFTGQWGSRGTAEVRRHAGTECDSPQHANSLNSCTDTYITPGTQTNLELVSSASLYQMCTNAITHPGQDTRHDSPQEALSPACCE